MAHARALDRNLVLRFVFILLVCVAFPVAGDVSDDEPFREAMREFVIRIAALARESNPEFDIVVQNGLELLTFGGSPEGTVAGRYVDAIDGQACEDLFYGYEADDRPTPRASTDWALAYLDLAENLGIRVLAVDYCRKPTFVADSRQRCADHGFLCFPAPARALDTIPRDLPAVDPSHDVGSLSEARSPLYLINPHRYPEREAFLRALREASADLLIIDAFFEDGGALTARDVESIRISPERRRRLVYAYLSIGEAETYRPDWEPSWLVAPPEWLEEENPEWPGNFTVRYWMDAWQAVVLERLEGLVAAGFDGVYLDRVDVYEAYE